MGTDDVILYYYEGKKASYLKFFLVHQEIAFLSTLVFVAMTCLLNLNFYLRSFFVYHKIFVPRNEDIFTRLLNYVKRQLN